MTTPQQQRLNGIMDTLYHASEQVAAAMNAEVSCGPEWDDLYVIAQAVHAAITQGQCIRRRDEDAAAADAGACACDTPIPFVVVDFGGAL
jgi:hypothetical protein